MLIRRLIFDTFRRLWMVYAFLSGAIFVLCWLAGQAYSDGVNVGAIGDIRALSMGGAWFGACMPWIGFEARELACLPVSRREVWMARWWLATVVPAVLIAATLAVATRISGSQFAGADGVILPALYAFLYSGCFMAVTTLLPLKQPEEVTWRSDVRFLFIFVVVMLGGAAWPFLFVQHLPRTFAEFNAPVGNILIAALGTTIASYFYRPRIAPRAGRPQWKKAPPQEPARDRIAGQLTGLSFLSWSTARRPAILLTSTLAAVIAYWRLVEPGLTLVEFLQAGGALPFADTAVSGRPDFPVGTVMLIAITASDLDLITDLRRLRSLPLSTSRLAAVLTGYGVIFAGVLWLWLLAIQAVVAGGWPVTLRPDLFMMVAGGVAMSQTARIALPANGFVRVVTGGLCIAPAFVCFTLAYAPQPWGITLPLVAGGALILGASFVINRWSLRNSSRVYKKEVMALPFTTGTPQERM